jgi:PAS domain S-box-containing protein
MDQAISTRLERSPYKIELYNENLEVTLFPDEPSQRRLREGYARKYADRKPDLIIAVGPASLRFMIESHERFFPDTPVVFCGSTEDVLNLLKPEAHFTGAWVEVQPEKTLDAALHMLPLTKHVVVVGGVGSIDREAEALVKARLRKHESQFDFTYLTDLAMPALLERLRHLPTNTIVFHTAITQDAAGEDFIDATQSVPLVVSAANAPVFPLDDVDVGNGTVGGDVLSWASTGQVAGEMAVSILSGEKPQSIPISKSNNVYMFDWRALRRWGISEDSLPPGSIVLNRQPTSWELYWRYVLTGLVLFLAQALLILALLVQRARRKRSEKSLMWRLEFEGLISDLSTTYIGLPEDKVDANIEQDLARLGEFLEMDRITLFELSRDSTGLIATHAWNAPGVMKAPSSIEAKSLPWWRGKVLGGNVSLMSRLEDLPEEASTEKQYFRERGIVSAASVPLKVGGEITGTITFVSTKRRVSWTEDLVNQLSVIGDIFCNALKRKRGMEALLTAQAVVFESEKRFRLVANTAPVMIWMSGIDKICTYVNQGWLEFTGRPTRSELACSWAYGVHPDDSERSLETYTQAFDRRESFQMEYRLWRKDGEYRWIFDQGVPRFNADGSFAGYIGSAIDISERKLAEEALSTVSQKLIEAQEQERCRIARELHDDINQQLALLAINLESLKQGVPASAVGLAQRIGETSKQIAGIAEDIQALSHHLHSPKLEYLGLAVAAKSFCREFSDQQKVEITFHSENIPKELPQEISICLFRVLQEALQNATKHSGSRRFHVSLKNGTNEIELTVHDSGHGFDPEEAIKGRGLGMTSMRERLKLVNGELSIDSQFERGTTIKAHVPFSAMTKSVGTGIS